MARGRGLGFAGDDSPERLGSLMPKETNPKARKTMMKETDIFRRKKLCNRTPKGFI
jgi:hypothetical protein